MPLKSGLSSQKAIFRTTMSSRYLGASGAGRFQTTRTNTGNPPNLIPVDKPGLAVDTGVAALAAAAAASQQGGKESAAKGIMKSRARRLMVGRATVRQTPSISARKQAPPTGSTSSSKALNPTPAPAYGLGSALFVHQKRAPGGRFSYPRKACCAHRMSIFAFSL